MVTFFFGGHFRYPYLQQDGKFGVFTCERVGLMQKINLVRSLAQGKFPKEKDEFSESYLQETAVASERSFDFELDGELFVTKSVTFQCVQSEVQLCPML